MTLTEFSKEIVPIIQAGLTALGLISVVLVWWQIRRNWKWNKVDATFRCMEVDKFAQIESDALMAAKALGIKLTEPISEDDAKKLRANHDAYLKLKAFVIFLDRQAVGYLAGYFDTDVLAHTYGPLIQGYSKTLANYFKVTRVETGNLETYVELERAAEKLDGELKARMRGRAGDGVGNRL